MSGRQFNVESCWRSNLKEVGCKDGRWTEPADSWVLVFALLNFRFPQPLRQFITKLDLREDGGMWMELAQDRAHRCSLDASCGRSKEHRCTV